LIAIAARNTQAVCSRTRNGCRCLGIVVVVVVDGADRNGWYDEVIAQ
jgi:hypothetical protein